MLKLQNINIRLFAIFTSVFIFISIYSFYTDLNLKKKEDKFPNAKIFLKNFIKGFFKGFLLGILFNGFGIALRGGVILGVLNPILTLIDYYI